jgi:arylsulfatase A-like enzyme
MREGGIREPMLVKWPEITKSESVSSHQVIIEDFYPSILEMAGIDSLNTVQKVDGQSFVPILEGETYDGARSLFWHYPNQWGGVGPGIGAASAIRKGDWKLIYYHLDQRMELFNLKDDIGETKNLAEENPEKLKDLATTLSNYLKGLDAQMPKHKTTDEPIPLPIELLEP